MQAGRLLALDNRHQRLLRAAGRLQHMLSTLPVQFREDVVEKQQRFLAQHGPQVARLRQPKRQRRRPHLPARPKLPHVQPADGHPQVVAVRPHQALGHLHLPLPPLGQQAHGVCRSLLLRPGVVDARRVRHLEGAVVRGHGGVGVCALRREPFDGVAPPPCDLRPQPAELAVPVVQFRRAGQPLADAPQELVPLRDHPLILLERSQVAAIGLGEQHVQVSAAVGRRARDDVEVVRREQHGGDGPDRLPRGLGHAVDAHALLEDKRASLARRQRHVDLHLHRRPGPACRGAGDPRVRCLLQRR